MSTVDVSPMPPSGARRGSDFATLSREVRRAGDSWWQLLMAVFFAAMYTQLAFIGHDAGHKQIFRGRRGNDVVGYLHGGLVGLSYDWWVGKHTRHHANPNHEDDDPDLDISALAFTRDQARNKQGSLRHLRPIPTPHRRQRQHDTPQGQICVMSNFTKPWRRTCSFS